MLQELGALADVEYLLYGREIAPTTGVRHLQGYIVFVARKSFSVVRGLLPGAHLERAKGNHKQNVEYCRKEGDFVEFGVAPPDAAGKRTDFERYVEWCKSRDSRPTDLEIIESFPSLFGRYREACRTMARELCPRPIIRGGEPRPWQLELEHHLLLPADDRSVEFYVDTDGGMGKSWLCGFVYTKYPNVQLLGPGKRDDLAHMVDVSSRIFLINVPRGQMEYLNYGFLENLKDRMVLSPKYESQMKVLKETPHVIVFSNEDPDMTKMSNDRYKIKTLG